MGQLFNLTIQFRDTVTVQRTIEIEERLLEIFSDFEIDNAGGAEIPRITVLNLGETRDAVLHKVRTLMQEYRGVAYACLISFTYKGRTDTLLCERIPYRAFNSAVEPKAVTEPYGKWEEYCNNMLSDLDGLRRAFREEQEVDANRAKLAVAPVEQE